MTGAASADVPLFAAKCGAGITTDSNSKGQIYINGKVARVIKRPDGQISANSAGVWVDITPHGGSMPRITDTAKDKTTGECEVSFKAPGGGAHGSSAPSRGDSAERAERELEKRDFVAVDGSQSSSDFSNLWMYNRQTGQCVQMETVEGKVMTINEVKHPKCR